MVWRTAVKFVVRRAPLVLGGVFVALVVLELTARVFHLGPSLDTQYGGNVPDPFIPYRRRPLTRVTGRSDDFAFDYQHNSAGFRDGEHAPEKPPGVFRIVALGDSFTYGVGAPFDDTYLARVERLLNERPGRTRQVEVIKLGLPRYFPEAERLVLEHDGLPYHPDLIMVAFLPNDIVDTYEGLEVIRVRQDGFLSSQGLEHLGAVAVWLSRHSRVIRSLLVHVAAFVRERTHPVHGQDIYRDGGFHEPDWRKVESEFERMQELARQNGADFVIVSIPQHGPWPAERDYPDQRLARWSAGHGVVFIPTLPALRAASTQQLYWPKDGHCTPAGYGVIAQTIAAELMRLQVVP
jgi:hypothetical protein